MSRGSPPWLKALTMSVRRPGTRSDDADVHVRIASGSPEPLRDSTGPYHSHPTWTPRDPTWTLQIFHFGGSLFSIEEHVKLKFNKIRWLLNKVSIFTMI
jgi:hypothetical protein